MASMRAQSDLCVSGFALARIKKQRYAEDSEYRERILARNRAWCAAHKEKVAERRRLSRAQHPEWKSRRGPRPSQRKDHLKHHYGISVEEYEALLKRQGSTCAICRKESTQALCVDHCHITREVRGLLCRTCNLGIGHFNDDPRLLHAALAYLEAFQDGDSERALHANGASPAAATGNEFTPN
jgi:hypothetical protein